METWVIYIVTILMIGIVAIAKSIADVLKNNAQFDVSRFAKYANNKYISTKDIGHNKSFIGGLFGDLWHTCNTIMLGTLMAFPLIIFILQPDMGINHYLILYLVWWLEYGLVFNWFRNMWLNQ